MSKALLPLHVGTTVLIAAVLFSIGNVKPKSVSEPKVSRFAAEVCEEVRRVLADYEPSTETLDRYQAKNIVNRCYNLYSND